MRQGEELFQVEGTLWVLTAPTGLPVYDFAFDRFLACRRPWVRPASLEAVARVGAFDDYATRYRELLAEGVRLAHSPEEHLRCSTLPGWYPLLEGMTPRSVCFDAPPSAREVGEALGWPVFAKGVR